ARRAYRREDDPADLHRGRAHRRLHRSVRRLAQRPDAAPVERQRRRLRYERGPRPLHAVAEMAAAPQERLRETAMTTNSLPVIDVSDLSRAKTLVEIDAACRDWGFFQITGHGIDERITAALKRQMRAFFAQPL